MIMNDDSLKNTPDIIDAAIKKLPKHIQKSADILYNIRSISV